MKVLSFDTETTGLPRRDLPDDHPDQAWIISLGAALHDIRKDKTELTYSSLVNPPTGVVFDPKALAVNGLKEADIRAMGAPVEVALSILEAMIRRADLVIAYNLPFDAAMLRYAGSRTHTHYKEFPLLGPHVRQMCVMHQAMQHFGARLKLGVVYQKLLNKPLDGAHGALPDALGTLEVWKEMTRIQLEKVHAAKNKKG